MEIGIDTSGEQATILPPSRFTSECSVAFRAATQPLLGKDGKRTLRVHFANVDYMDSSAMGLLILLRTEAQQFGQSVTLSHCKPELRRLLAMAHFDKLFHIE